ncbi:MAG TPA: hypothetical protein DDZ66_06575 [Firmicutes bacterium]|jgi:GrpB-like predicted nucleotidyltransferase (UPF0157 family)|nr:hypothetical protein [Bacillota bacterium]
MKVVVTEYNPQWPALFEAEAAHLRRVFGSELLQIHHIGSTSVPGLQAKPIIDIMPVVADIRAVDKLTEKMVELGYEALGEYGIPGRRYFRKGGENRTHHVHVFEVGSADAQRHLAFRDFLRAHPDEATRYGDLKASLARQYPDNIEAYMDGKQEYIQRVEGEALGWVSRS